MFSNIGAMIMSNEFYEGQKLVATGIDEHNNPVEAVVLFGHYLEPENYEKVELESGRIGILDCVICVNSAQNYSQITVDAYEKNFANSLSLSTIH